MCFFVKHKTAYEVRISDWSSDVCSSDLRGFDWPVLRYRSNHENGYDHRPEKPVPNRFYLRLARSERAQDRGPTFNHGFVIPIHNLALFCFGCQAGTTTCFSLIPRPVVCMRTEERSEGNEGVVPMRLRGAP